MYTRPLWGGRVPACPSKWKTSMLWLAIHLPHLPLEVYSRGLLEAMPLVVSDGHARSPSVLDCNAVAMEQGIQNGMPLGAAHALSPRLHVRTQDTLAEQQILEGLAAWAGQFSSLVSLQPGQGILLEIGGSLRLFGGAEPLMAQIREGLAALGYDAGLAVAPTPEAARVLVLSGQDRYLDDLDSMRALLARLPLHYLDLPLDILQALKGLGLVSVRDLRRLPRDGMTRRYGPALTRYLDRLLGHSADPRQPYVVPARFHSRLILPAEVESAPALLFAVRRLLQELDGFLRARCYGARHLLWTLIHDQAADTVFELGLSHTVRDVSYLTELMQTRLESLQIPEAAEELILQVSDMAPLSGEEGDLSLQAGPRSMDVAQPAVLIERLHARLGDELVTGLASLPDHRPEKAWQFVQRDAILRPVRHRQGAEPHSPLRPLWLLSEPERLSQHRRRPCYRGALQLLKGPERIESGWWDGQPIRRDYYIASNTQGERFWIFRSLDEPQIWYLHGVFA